MFGFPCQLFFFVRDIITQAENPLSNSKFWGKSPSRERDFQIWVYFFLSYMYFWFIFFKCKQHLVGVVRIFALETSLKNPRQSWENEKTGRCFKLVTNHTNTKTRTKTKYQTSCGHTRLCFLYSDMRLFYCFVEDYCCAIISPHSFYQIVSSWLCRCPCMLRLQILNKFN